MRFSDYLDCVDNAEQHQQLKVKICELKEAMEKGAGIPVIGKYVRAAIAFGECESIEEFKQTPDYEKLKNWEITIHDKDDGDFDFGFQPGEEQIEKISKVVGTIITCLFALWAIRKIYRKLFGKKRKS